MRLIIFHYCNEINNISLIQLVNLLKISNPYSHTCRQPSKINEKTIILDFNLSIVLE
jgi:hypothetical protein